MVKFIAAGAGVVLIQNPSEYEECNFQGQSIDGACDKMSNLINFYEIFSLILAIFLCSL